MRDPLRYPATDADRPKVRARDRHRLRALPLIIGILATLVVGVACEPTLPPGVTAPPSAAGSGAGGSPGSSEPAPVAGSPTVTTDGTTAVIVGLGNGESPPFELPAGNAAMVITPCESSQVIPFVTLFDGDDNKLGIIVEPEYRLKDLAGGAYYVSVAANPDCVWTIEVTPG